MECNKYYIPTKDKIKIAMAGAPSSGKDTLCDALSAMISNSNLKIQEAARIYLEQHGELYSPFQQKRIFDLCKKREDEALNTYQIVWCPGGRFLCYFYTAMLTPRKYDSAELDNLVHIYEQSVEAISDYDYIFFCESLEYEKDGLRYQTKDDNTLLQDSILSFLQLHHVEFTYLGQEPVIDRYQKVLEVLDAKPIDTYKG